MRTTPGSRHAENRDRRAVESISDGRVARSQEIRLRLLETAQTLIRENGDVSFSTRELARRAGVSQATPFNHFGSKRGVLGAIVARTFLELADRLKNDVVSLDPIERIFEAAQIITALYADDPALFRPVFGELLGSREGEPDQTVREATASWLRGLRAAEIGGQIESGRNLEIIASQLEAQWIGTLAGWISATLDKRSWLDCVHHGTALILSSIATQTERQKLKRRLLAAEKALAKSRRA